MDDYHSGSPFFRFPLELREEIYFHYFWEPDGYHHHPSTGKLRTADDEPIDLSLRYVCKLIAQETSGIALGTNTIKFKTIPHAPVDRNDVTKPDRFARVLTSHRVAFLVMLSWAAKCVTPDVIRALREQFPLNKEFIRFEEASEEDRVRRLEDVRADFEDHLNGGSVRDVVRLASNHPDFYNLTALESCLELRGDDRRAPYHRDRASYRWDPARLDEYYRGPPTYVENSQRKLIDWDLPSWHIPSDAELNELETLLPHRASKWDDQPTGRRNFVDKRMAYFSATSAAIQFLQQLDLSSRSQVRTLMIHEDHSSEATSKRYARDFSLIENSQGLIPFCIENRKLRIETRVDIWRTLLLPNYNPRSSWVDTREALTTMLKWMKQASWLFEWGMPPNAFSTTFQGFSTESPEQFANMFKRLAAFSDAIATYPGEEERPLFFGREKCGEFIKMAKDIIYGNTTVKFDVTLGELWDVRETHQEYVRERAQVARFAWWKFLLLDELEPPQGWKAMDKEYILRFRTRRGK